MKGLSFVPDMAVAACVGTKTETRRIIAPQPKHYEGGTSVIHSHGDRWLVASLEGDESGLRCDYVVGERRCLLTTWAVHQNLNDDRPLELPIEKIAASPTERFWHVGLGTPKPETAGISRAGRFLPNGLRHLMPVFEIVAVRAERVQDITRKAACAEGVNVWTKANTEIIEKHFKPGGLEPEQWFAVLWDSINANRGPGKAKEGYGWNFNPFVWVVQFKKISP